MDIPKTLFATLVKQGRMEMHLTQEALAEKLGISAAYLGDLERHKGGPSLELFCKTMQTLSISADDCIFRKNCASVPEERSAIPLQTEQSSAG